MTIAKFYRTAAILVVLSAGAIYAVTTGMDAEGQAANGAQQSISGCCGGAGGNFRMMNDGDKAPLAADAAKIDQQTCPVMGNPVTADSPYVVVKGRKIYYCCPPCAAKIKADPDKFIKLVDEQIKAAGKTPPKTDGVKAEASAKPQTICPIMGNEISKKLYVDVDGYRIYVCCPPCRQAVKKDPKAAIAKIRANGQEPEKLK